MDSQRLTKGIEIPTRVRYLSQCDTQDYSSTPGGTLYSTTPGGTRIIYTKKDLMKLASSPVAKEVPACLQHVPGVTKNTEAKMASPLTTAHTKKNEDDCDKKIEEHEDTEFQLEL